MRTTARAVVIGGGIGGCSALYHLAEEGWTDIVLLERDELTSGTTWHSAAQVTNFGAVPTMVGLKSHSIRLYRALAEDPEHPINYHHGDGGLRLASEPWHLEGYRHFQSMAKGMGVDFEILDAQECARRHPLIATDGLIGALWDPMDGDIDPAQLCQALARRARAAGAEVHRRTPVTGLTETRDGWIVHTPRGEIRAEHVVNAGGYRCNEVAAMMGVRLPVASLEHQYFVTEPIGAVAALDRRVPLVRCPTDDFYARQEKQGLLVGFYEQDCRTWGLDGIDPTFTMALSPDDPDRVLPVLESVFRRMPCLTEAGIRTIINGPITYTPDGVPLVGRVPGRRNAWCITGLRAGLGEGGGHGRLLAQMMVHGEAEFDTWCLDPRRFGAWATVEYAAVKAVEDYRNEFRFHRPHEFRSAGRRMRTTPLYPALAAAGAAFGVVNGWERALCYPTAPGFSETHGFGFTESFEVVAREVETVRLRVGLAEVGGFTRIEIAGRGARAWLDGLVCGRTPRRVGTVGLAYALAENAGVKCEATLAVLEEERVLGGSAAAAELHDLEWLRERLPADGSVSLTPLTEAMTLLVVAGPRARALMAAVAPRTDWSTAGFPWLAVRRVFVGPVEVVALSVSHSGETAFELHVPNAGLLLVHDLLADAGAALGLGRFGTLAADSMRLEKGYRHWKADLVTEFDPFESGLGRFVDLAKPAFPGRAALERRVAEGPRRRFASLLLDDGAAPAHPGDSLLGGDTVVGTVTSGGWGHRVGENIAMGFVDPPLAEPGTRLDALVLGRRVRATVVPPCRYDPENRRQRA